MATVNYTITGSSAENWSGSFTVSNAANPIKTQLPTSSNSAKRNFNVQQFATFNEYITWRSVNISAQPSGPPDFLDIYPRTGYSFDIWSPTLITDVNANRTWSYLNGKSYNLNVNKNTLIYDYANMNAVYYARGGSIAFTVV